MAGRRSLTAAIEKMESIDPAAVQAFIRQENPENPKRETLSVVGGETPRSATTNREESESGSNPTPKMSKPVLIRRPNYSQNLPIGLVPITVRLRPELAAALKRASLERQLSGAGTFTQQDIVEEALLPWLQAEGILE